MKSLRYLLLRKKLSAKVPSPLSKLFCRSFPALSRPDRRGVFWYAPYTFVTSEIFRTAQQSSQVEFLLRVEARNTNLGSTEGVDTASTSSGSPPVDGELQTHTRPPITSSPFPTAGSVLHAFRTSPPSPSSYTSTKRWYDFPFPKENATKCTEVENMCKTFNLR
jgi:hypothetical protein